jgi:hypothetical protein
MSHYKNIVIETYPNISGASSKSLRARPVSSQDLNASMNSSVFIKNDKKLPC